MNIKQLFLPLVGALALIGCNKEAVEPTSSNTTQANSVTLALSLEGTADASEMRAVSFDANQNVPPTTHDQYSDWTTHCFLRNAEGSKKAYAVINWDATLEGGKVKLKMRGHELQLLPIGSSSAELSPENKPVAGERWSIVGITGGGKLNEERTRVDFAPDAELDKDLQPHQARVPFTFERTFFTVAAASGERAPQVSVRFKPQGSLLNIRVNNKTAETLSTVLTVVSNALSNSGYYDYSTGEAQWTFTQVNAQPENLSRRIAIAQSATKDYLLWGMPRPEAEKPAEGFKSEVVFMGYQVSTEGSPSQRPKIRTEAFTNAIAYPMSIDINLSLSPLNKLITTGAPDYVAKFMNGLSNDFMDTREFNSASELRNSGILFTQQDAITHYGRTSSSNTSSYYLPSIWELGTIFPSQRAGFSGYQSYNFTDSDITVNELVQFVPGESITTRKRVTSSYKASGGVLYADRFKDFAGGVGNNEKRTVFRYEYLKIKDLADGTALHGLKITTRYLGNSGDANDYDTEGYWTDMSKNADDITVIFPALGHKGVGTTGTHAYYWSSTPHPTNSAVSYTVYFTFDRINALSNGVNDEENNIYGLILFPKN